MQSGREVDQLDVVEVPQPGMPAARCRRVTPWRRVEWGNRSDGPGEDGSAYRASYLAANRELSAAGGAATGATAPTSISTEHTRVQEIWTTGVPRRDSSRRARICAARPVAANAAAGDQEPPGHVAFKIASGPLNRSLVAVECSSSSNRGRAVADASGRRPGCSICEYCASARSA